MKDGQKRVALLCLCPTDLGMGAVWRAAKRDRAAGQREAEGKKSQKRTHSITGHLFSALPLGCPGRSLGRNESEKHLTLLLDFAIGSLSTLAGRPTMARIELELNPKRVSFYKFTTTPCRRLVEY